jgi:4-amino-4-deoxy-L-arabinose transferase-like glycosyltransferase
MLRRALPKLVLIALLIAGAGLRLHFAERIVGYDEDYATAALMSKHIAEGKERPLYFYGFPYIAAVGAYVGAAFFAIFGASLTSLSAAMLPFSCLWIFATYLLFRRLVNEWGGVIAAAVVALPPLFVTWYSAVPLIGYPPTLAFGTLILYFGVRLNDRDLTPRGQWLCILGLGALAGLAIWTHLLCLPYLVVGFGLLVAHVVRTGLSRDLLVKLGAALVLFLLTFLPVIVAARTHGLAAMFWHWPSKLEYVPWNLRAVVSWYVPNQLLAVDRMPLAVNRLVGAAYAVLGVGFVAGFVVAVLKRRAGPVRAGLVPVVFVAIFLLSFLPNSMARTLSPRFFTPFYLGIAACFAFPLAYRRAWLSTATTILAAAVIAFNVAAALRVAGGTTARRVEQKDAQLLTASTRRR